MIRGDLHVNLDYKLKKKGNHWADNVMHNIIFESKGFCKNPIGGMLVYSSEFFLFF